MRKHVQATTVVLLLAGQAVWAQPSLQKIQNKQQLRQQNGNATSFQLQINEEMPEQGSILFAEKLVPAANTVSWLGEQMEFRSGVDALHVRQQQLTSNGISVEKFQQFFKGIKVEHGTVSATAFNGTNTTLQLEFYTIDDAFKTSPDISEGAALQFATKRIGATKYIWGGYAGNDPEYMQPKGELVIVQDMLRKGKMCLCYKFEIYAEKPFSRDYVYVNAWDGTIVLVDNLIQHANRNGKAETLFSGTQTITTDSSDVSWVTPYRLRQVRNGHNILTLDFGRRDRSAENELLAKDFFDDDNMWTTAEHANNLDVGALDAHFNMSIVSDYWFEIHGRASWDGMNSAIKSYVHVTKAGAKMDNAYWNKSAMYFGDGSATDPPQTSIDDCGHEFGHAINQGTAKLVYRWESGALNEGFSDIWAACITNYAVAKNNTLGPAKSIWRLFEESSNPANAEPGLRDMSNPALFNDPDFYKNDKWITASFEQCPNPDATGVDYCGVHTNSGVLNKWFYLITAGGAGNTYRGQPYNVPGLGFDKSQKIAYLTELNLTPNAGYGTTKNVSINAAIALFGDGAEAESVRKAWVAVGVDSTVYKQSNTPVFATDFFTSIAVGKGGYIWAGTSAPNGLYRYNGKIWEKAPLLLNNTINQILPDSKGGIWIAQSGYSGAQATTGGVNYFSDSTFASNTFYGVSDGLSSRNVRSIYLDNTHENFFSGKPKVWAASLGQVTAGEPSAGGIGIGENFVGSFFTKVNQGIDKAGGVGGVQTIGGNDKEIWAYSSKNYGKDQILRYDAETGDSMPSFDYTNTSGGLPQSFTAKAIYIDAKGNRWLGMQGPGVIVQDWGGGWHTVKPASIFPAGSIVTNNAITGDKTGKVYIGTSTGLVVYTGGSIDDVSSYRLLTTANGLPSNNIRAVAVDNFHYKLLVATDNGVIFFDQICNSKEDCAAQIVATKAAVSSVKAGNWSDPTIWSAGVLPDENTLVSLTHAVTVDVDAICYSLTVAGTGTIHVNTGKKLEIKGFIKEVIEDRKKW
jgi:Zn-dependent metalloprotease